MHGTDRPARHWLGAAMATLLIGVPVAGALERDEVTIDNGQQRLRLEVEIARTARERAHGLMGREHLDADAGMLFVYQRRQSPDSGFWMYRTLIPLDIAFLGSDGEIRAIRTMTPCPSEQPATCPSYDAGVPFQAALEVNAGYFENHDIEVGDRITLP